MIINRVQSNIKAASYQGAVKSIKNLTKSLNSEVFEVKIEGLSFRSIDNLCKQFSWKKNLTIK